ncbi:TetR family transcriptional regulator [Paractinoplanes tereljensis]|uniref:TetR family transcriptional regulator n=1 Tax=Paractinoplanes tereljensis TaxID=571912 RepID=A0A919TX95_9ACTN|nr:TetR family transcriptional regulator [Actinoplanes tereljensis]
MREEKKQATRTALSWAAIRLIVARGYEKVLVEDIAAEVGVSPRTFNNYFGSKAEAVAFRHLDRCERMAEALRARPAGEPLWESIEHVMLETFKPGPEVTAHPRPDREAWAAGLHRMLAVPALQAEYLRAGAMAEAALAEAVGDRTGTDAATNIYPQLVAATMVAAQNVASRNFMAGSDTMRTLLVEALHQITKGLPPPA